MTPLHFSRGSRPGQITFLEERVFAPDEIMPWVVLRAPPPPSSPHQEHSAMPFSSEQIIDVRKWAVAQVKREHMRAGELVTRAKELEAYVLGGATPADEAAEQASEPAEPGAARWEPQAERRDAAFAALQDTACRFTQLERASVTIKAGRLTWCIES